MNTIEHPNTPAELDMTAPSTEPAEQAAAATSTEPAEPATASTPAEPTPTTVSVENSQWHTAGQAEPAAPPMPNPLSGEASQMDPESQRLQRRVSSGRGSIAIAAVLSLVNLVLLWLGSETEFLFSLSSPSIFVGFGMGISEQIGSNIPTIIGAVAGLLVIVIFGLLFLFSKKSLVAWVVAGILSVADTAMLLWLMTMMEDPSALALNVLFHIWLVGSILWGFLAARKLKQKASLM